MRGHGGEPDFETVIGADGKIQVPGGVLSRAGTGPGSRVKVTLLPAGIAKALERRNVTAAEVDRIAGLQLESREQVIAFLLAEGSLPAASGGARRKGRGKK